MKAEKSFMTLRRQFIDACDALCSFERSRIGQHWRADLESYIEGLFMPRQDITSARPRSLLGSYGRSACIAANDEVLRECMARCGRLASQGDDQGIWGQFKEDEARRHLLRGNVESVLAACALSLRDDAATKHVDRAAEEYSAAFSVASAGSQLDGRKIAERAVKWLRNECEPEQNAGRNVQGISVGEESFVSRTLYLTVQGDQGMAWWFTAVLEAGDHMLAIPDPLRIGSIRLSRELFESVIAASSYVFGRPFGCKPGGGLVWGFEPSQHPYTGKEIGFGGRSGGASFAVCFRSALERQRLDQNRAVSATIDKNGNLGSVDGMLQKIEAARKCNCTNVFFYQSPENEVASDGMVRPVKSFDQLWRVMTASEVVRSEFQRKSVEDWKSRWPMGEALDEGGV